MNVLDLTVNQLKRAAAIKQQIEDLNKELNSILGVRPKSPGVSPSKRTMGASVRKKIAAAQKARWARLRSARPTKPSANKAKKKTMTPAARAKLSAKLKAYWAAKKSGKK